MLSPLARDHVRDLERKREKLLKEHSSLFRELAPTKDTTSEKYFRMKELGKQIMEINHEIYEITVKYRKYNIVR